MIRELEQRMDMIPMHICTIVINLIYALKLINNQNIGLAIPIIIFMTIGLILFFWNISRCHSIMKDLIEIEELAIIKYNEKYENAVENSMTEQKTRD